MNLIIVELNKYVCIIIDDNNDDEFEDEASRLVQVEEKEMIGHELDSVVKSDSDLSSSAVFFIIIIFIYTSLNLLYCLQESEDVSCDSDDDYAETLKMEGSQKDLPAVILPQDESLCCCGCGADASGSQHYCLKSNRKMFAFCIPAGSSAEGTWLTCRGCNTEEESEMNINVSPQVEKTTDLIDVALHAAKDLINSTRTSSPSRQQVRNISLILITVL